MIVTFPAIFRFTPDQSVLSETIVPGRKSPPNVTGNFLISPGRDSNSGISITLKITLPPRHALKCRNTPLQNMGSKSLHNFFFASYVQKL